MGEVPQELEPYPHFSKDEELCRRWDELTKKWRSIDPELAVIVEVAKAHEHQAARRRKSKVRFLNNWMLRVAQYRDKPTQSSKKWGEIYRGR